MRTVRTKIYRFNELSQKAKDRAIEKYLQDEDFYWITEEATETFKKFADIFNVNWRQIDYMEPYRNEYRVNVPDNAEELTGQRLATYIWNNYRSDIFKGKYYGKLVNTHKDGTPIEASKEHPAGLRHVLRYSRCQMSNDCVLTGVCYDMDILDPIYKFLEKPTEGTTFEELINDCISSLCKSVSSEIEANMEEPAISEHFEANDYEFTEDGRRF